MKKIIFLGLVLVGIYGNGSLQARVDQYDATFDHNAMIQQVADLKKKAESLQVGASVANENAGILSNIRSKMPTITKRKMLALAAGLSVVATGFAYNNGYFDPYLAMGNNAFNSVINSFNGTISSFTNNATSTDIVDNSSVSAFNSTMNNTNSTISGFTGNNASTALLKYPFDEETISNNDGETISNNIAEKSFTHAAFTAIMRYFKTEYKMNPISSVTDFSMFQPNTNSALETCPNVNGTPAATDFSMFQPNTNSAPETYPKPEQKVYEGFDGFKSLVADSFNFLAGKLFNK